MGHETRGSAPGTQASRRRPRPLIHCRPPPPARRRPAPFPPASRAGTPDGAHRPSPFFARRQRPGRRRSLERAARRRRPGPRRLRGPGLRAAAPRHSGHDAAPSTTPRSRRPCSPPASAPGSPGRSSCSAAPGLCVTRRSRWRSLLAAAWPLTRHVRPPRRPPGHRRHRPRDRPRPPPPRREPRPRVAAAPILGALAIVLLAGAMALGHTAGRRGHAKPPAAATTPAATSGAATPATRPPAGRRHDARRSGGGRRHDPGRPDERRRPTPGEQATAGGETSSGGQATGRRRRGRSDRQPGDERRPTLGRRVDVDARVDVEAFVAHYYAALNNRRFTDAWKVLSPAVQAHFGGLAQWEAGFGRTVSSTPHDLVVTPAPTATASPTSSSPGTRPRAERSWSGGSTSRGSSSRTRRAGWQVASLHGTPAGAPPTRTACA